MNRLSEFFNVNSFIVSQTNPFMVPIQDFSENIRYKNRVVMGAILLAEKLKKLVILEMKHRIHQLISLGIVPERSSKYVHLFQQSYTGHITIIPVPSLTDYKRILQMPKSQAEIDYYIDRGAKRIFNRIPYIEAYTRFERNLEECLLYIKENCNEEDDNKTIGA